VCFRREHVRQLRIKSTQSARLIATAVMQDAADKASRRMYVRHSHREHRRRTTTLRTQLTPRWCCHWHERTLRRLQPRTQLYLGERVPHRRVP
jgi:phage FluMu gp28-like protein